MKYTDYHLQMKTHNVGSPSQHLQLPTKVAICN